MPSADLGEHQQCSRFSFSPLVWAMPVRGGRSSRRSPPPPKREHHVSEEQAVQAPACEELTSWRFAIGGACHGATAVTGLCRSSPIIGRMKHPLETQRHRRRHHRAGRPLPAGGRRNHRRPDAQQSGRATWTRARRPPRAARARRWRRRPTYFGPTALLGIYLARSQAPRPARTSPTCALPSAANWASTTRLAPLDTGIVRTLWMTAGEVRASAARHRSPLVLRCIEDYLAGRAATRCRWSTRNPTSRGTAARPGWALRTRANVGRDNRTMGSNNGWSSV